MDENLDRILCSDQDVVPSSAFVRNVMAVVRHEASIPGSNPISLAASSAWIGDLRSRVNSLTRRCRYSILRRCRCSSRAARICEHRRKCEPRRPWMDCARAPCLICPDAARVRKNLTQSKIIWLGIPPHASVAVIGFLV